MTLRRALALFFMVPVCPAAHAQDLPSYSRRNTLSTFVEYSNNSNHILLGVSQNRRLAALGFTVSHRLLHTRTLDWNYSVELRPVLFLADPISTISGSLSQPGKPTQTFQDTLVLGKTCTSSSFTSTLPPPFSGTYSARLSCGSRWTFAGGISPLGQRFNFAPRRRLQPFLTGNAGFLVATHDVPVDDSSRFNFTFEFGVGLELFRTHHRSWSAEYRLHHISNDYTGFNNPGVDSQILKLTYAFGR